MMFVEGRSIDFFNRVERTDKNRTFFQFEMTVVFVVIGKGSFFKIGDFDAVRHKVDDAVVFLRGKGVCEPNFWNIIYINSVHSNYIISNHFKIVHIF